MPIFLPLGASLGLRNVFRMFLLTEGLREAVSACILQGSLHLFGTVLSTTLWPVRAEPRPAYLTEPCREFLFLLGQLFRIQCL